MQQPVRFSSRTKVITIWVLLILGVVFLYRVRGVVAPFFWAIVVAYIFTPLVRLLERRTRLPRAVWIILLYIGLGGLVYWAITGIVPLLAGQYDELLRSLPDILEDVQAFIQENGQVEILGFTLHLGALSNELATFLGDLARSIPEQALQGVSFVFETVLNGVIFLIATFYFLLHGEDWARQLFALLPPHIQLDLQPLLHRVHITLTAYIRGQVFLIAIMSTLAYIPLVILQVRFALVLALITGVLEIIPWLGPITAAGIAGLVALFQPETPFGWSNLTLCLVVLSIYTVLQQLENNFIVPNLFGYMVDLPPLLVLFVVLAGGFLAGPLGLLVAIPLAATIKIILRYLYAKLMDRPVVFQEVSGRKKKRRRRKEAKEGFR